MEVLVSSLNTYPIKGCAPVVQQQAQLGEHGLEYDREWMLVDDKNGFITQRRFPQLALVGVELSDTALHANAAGHGEVSVPLDPFYIDGVYTVDIDFFNKSGTGINQGSEVSRFFSDFLGKSVRLIRSAQPRTVKEACQRGGASQTIAFADGFPILLTSERSLAALNRELAEPIPMNRFRPNIVVSGSELEAYDEDYWRTAKIGDMSAYVVRACARCPVPNIDQQTGVQNRDVPVTKALKQTRSGIDSVDEASGYFFGQNLTHVLCPDMTIRVGDTVTVTERSDEPNIIF
jgi:uncharacterized protein YcbX